MTVIQDLQFSPVTKKRAFELISEEIKRLILSGRLKVGDRLPSESELARRFSVGRQTIREALRLLELSGYIKIEKGSGKGPVVVDTLMNTFSNLFLDAFLMKKISVQDLTIARLEIEKIILKYAMQNMTSEDIRLLEESVRISKESIGRKVQPFNENINFHRILAKISRNSVLTLCMELMMTVVSDFRSRVQLPFEFPKKNVLDHERLLESLKRRDLNEASSILERHLLYVGKKMEEALSRSSYFIEKIGERG